MCLFLPNTWICTDCLLHNWLIFYVISWGTEAWRWPGHVLLEVRLSKTWKGGRLFIVLNRRFVLCRSVELIVDSTVETLTFPSWSIWPTELNYRAEAAKLLWLYPAACYPQCTVTHPDSSVVLLYLMCCCVWCVVVIINYISLSVKSEQTASAAAGECLKSFCCSSAALIRTRQDTDTSPLTQGIHTQLLSAY